MSMTMMSPEARAKAIARDEKNLRDEFAKAAMQGLLANSGGPVQSNQMSGWGFVNCKIEHVAALSYEIADAMLAARKHEKGE